MTAQTARLQLAGLLALESVVDIVLHAVFESYRELHREPPADDAAITRSAATLVDLCSRLLAAIAVHRRHVKRRLHTYDHNWPY